MTMVVIIIYQNLGRFKICIGTLYCLKDVMFPTADIPGTVFFYGLDYK